MDVNLWKSIKRACAACWRKLTMPPYRAVQNEDGTWRIVNREDETIADGFPSEASAKNRIAELEREDPWL